MTYPDLDDVKNYLGISVGTDDTLLQEILDNIVGFVEIFTERTFVVAGDTTVNFEPVEPYVPSNKKEMLYLFRDLAQITSVTNGNGDTIAASSYTTKTTKIGACIYALRLTGAAVQSGIGWQFGSDGTPIQITGRWGYSVSCPDTIYEIILQLSAHDYRARSAGQGGTITSVSKRSGLVIGAAQLPNDVMRKLLRFRR